ncbi:acetylornithine deacetylase/succinyl-diaminopimelate desuccinylase-like protein [Paenarthrobacter nicotinovorans]|uniref:dipeptidase n=1 Tax=Micrococcaceae TaxID=1268 RepID=UPI000876F809|nr:MULTISPECIES: dipeptidase [Micrococcaceae]MDR6436266.1 acetylornithine deacetylase/succinyl-diaminopimelate desuccinylase-like protein [Paenarthrobacter nicotinovorans]SCZ58135.1 Acetylornithine deacetylase/Succinyl-diaminopimelate desuccinylase [Arthrobacter sp. UNCCL28]
MTSAHAEIPQNKQGHAGTTEVEALTVAVNDSFNTTLESLKDLVSIPGIAWASFDPKELDRSAEAVAALVKATGMDDVRILRCDKADGTPGGPAVVARRPAAEGKPTILLYAHHDVQPPGDSSLWNSEPFVAEEREGRLYGRGAADDKAGIMAHLAAYSAVTKVLGDGFGLGVTFFFEGEEEAGSPTFRTFLEEHQELLRADVIVVADSSNWKVGVPALTTSLRGLVDGTFEVRVLDHAVHSGMFGGPVLDAPTLISRLIATLHDDDGNVAVDGLVARDDVAVDLAEEDYRADASVLDGVKLAGSGTIASRLWTKPALSIIGMDVPSVDVASNTLIPAARAKFSMRLAPGQDPDLAMEALKAHLDSHAPFGAKVTFTPGERGNAFSTDTSSAAAKVALWALGESWGVQPVEMGIGGSIPFISDLTDLYPDVQILVTGVEDPDSRAHSANESLHIGDFRHAVLAEALMLARLNAEGLGD